MFLDFVGVHDLLVAGFWDKVNGKDVYGSLHLLFRKRYQKNQAVMDANRLISAQNSL